MEAVNFLELIDSAREGFNRIHSLCQEEYFETAAAEEEALSHMRTILSTVDQVIRLFIPRMQWTESPGHSVKLVYASGSTPWDFWLQWPDSDEIQRKLTSIFEKIREDNGLIPFTGPPRVGDVVCCVYRGHLYRCVVQSEFANHRLKVADVDSAVTRLLKLDDVYKLPRQLHNIKPLMLRCSLIPKDEVLAQVWVDDFANLFSSAFQDCDLTVDIDKISNSVPPVYKVHMVGFNRVLKSSFDFNEWMEDRLAPAIKDLVKRKITKNCIIKLDEYALDPFYQCSTPEKETLTTSSSFEPPDEPDSYQEELTEKVRRVEQWVMGETMGAVPVVNTKPRVYIEPEYCRPKSKNASVKDSNGIDNQAYFETFNSITLPHAGEKITVFVMSIVSATSCYCCLPLDLSGPGSFDTLMELMNDPSQVASYSTFDKEPLLYEIVIALNYDDKWVRGVVQEVIGEDIEIFYPDHAVKSTTVLSNIRKMKPEFLHLPFQAVLLELSGVYAPGPANPNALKELVLAKRVQIEVTSRSEKDPSISGIVITRGGVNVNEALIENGICDRLYDY